MRRSSKIKNKKNTHTKIPPEGQKTCRRSVTKENAGGKKDKQTKQKKTTETRLEHFPGQTNIRGKEGGVKAEAAFTLEA